MTSFDLFINPRRGRVTAEVLSAAGFRRARADITSWPSHAPTPLRELPGPGTIRLKDESGRFGLGSFKALGGAYAVARLVRRHGAAITVTSATDGNHGRAVAWAASRFGCRCVIYIHETVSAGREAAIAAFGAEVRRVAGTYDDAVRACARDAKAQGWFVVSDTSWRGYTQVPRAIMQGYRLMADEAADQWTGPPPTHVFIQGGVGGAAAAVSAQVRLRWGDIVSLIVVEPDRAACLLASARAGRVTRVGGALDTIMAGLACGEPSVLAWRELRGAAAFMAIPDTAAIDTMRYLAGLGIVAGESGVAGLAAFRLVSGDRAARDLLGLTPDSRVLTFSTEGATDPQVYARLVGRLP